MSVLIQIIFQASGVDEERDGNGEEEGGDRDVARTLCACGCGLDASGSKHVCRFCNQKIMAFCSKDQGGEGFGATGDCGCRDRAPSRQTAWSSDSEDDVPICQLRQTYKNQVHYA